MIGLCSCILSVLIFSSINCKNYVKTVDYLVDKFVSYQIPKGTKEVYYSLSAPNRIGVFILSENENDEVLSSTRKQHSFFDLNPTESYNFVLFNWNTVKERLVGSIYFVEDVSKDYKCSANTDDMVIGGEKLLKFYIFENTTKFFFKITTKAISFNYTIFDSSYKSMKTESKQSGIISRTVNFKTKDKPYFISVYPTDGSSSSIFLNTTFTFEDNTPSGTSWISSYWWIFLVIILPCCVCSFCCYVLFCCCCSSCCTISALSSTACIERTARNKLRYERLVSENAYSNEISRRNERDKELIKELRIKLNEKLDRKDKRIQELQTAFQKSATRMNHMVAQLREMNSQSQEVLGKLSQRDGLIEQLSKSLAQTKKQLLEKNEEIEQIRKSKKEDLLQLKESKDNTIRVLRDSISNKDQEIERLTEELESSNRQIALNEDQNTSYVHRISKYDEERITREKERVSLETKCEEYEHQIHEFETSSYEKELTHNMSMRKIEQVRNELEKKVKMLESEIESDEQKHKIELRQLEREGQERYFRETQRAEKAEQDLEDYKKRVFITEKKIEERDKELKELNLKHFDQITERDKAQSNISDLVGESMEKNQILQGNVTTLTQQISQLESEKREIESNLKTKDRLIAEKDNKLEYLKKDILDIQQEVLEHQKKHEDLLSEKEMQLEASVKRESEKDEKISKLLTSSEQAIAEKNAIIEEKEKINRGLKKEIEKSRETHVELQMKFFSLSKDKTRTIDELSQSKEKANKKSEILKGKEESIISLTNIVEEKDNEIFNLSKDLEELRNSLKISNQRLKDEELNCEVLMKERSNLNERVETLEKYVKKKQTELEGIQKEHNKEISQFRSSLVTLERKNNSFEKDLALSEERLRQQKELYEKLENQKKKLVDQLVEKNQKIENQAIKCLKLEGNIRDYQNQLRMFSKKFNNLEKAKRDLERSKKELRIDKDLEEKKLEGVIKTKNTQILLFRTILKKVAEAFDQQVMKTVTEKIKMMDLKLDKIKELEQTICRIQEVDRIFYRIQSELSKADALEIAEIGNLKKPPKDVSRLIKLLLIILGIETKMVSWQDLAKHFKGKNSHIKFVRSVLLFAPEEHINKTYTIEWEEVKRLEGEGLKEMTNNRALVLMLKFCKASLDLVFQKKRSKAALKHKFQIGIEVPKVPKLQKKKIKKKNSGNKFVRSPSSPHGVGYGVLKKSISGSKINI